MYKQRLGGLKSLEDLFVPGEQKKGFLRRKICSVEIF